MSEQVDGVEISADLIDALRLTISEIKRLEDTALAIKTLIKRALGEREYATVEGEPVIRWAHVKTRRLDMDLLRSSVDPAVLASCYVAEETRRFMPLSTKEERSRVAR